MAVSNQSSGGGSGFVQDEANTALHYAIRYSEIGWPTFPVEPGGKRPLARLALHGFKDATTGRDLHRARFRAAPDANLGLATGAASSVVVVDVDPRNGGDATLEALEARHGKLDTPLVARTGGGGLHLFFKYDGRQLPKELGKGIDLKGDGGYVVVEPSRTTKGYTFLDFDVLTDDLPELPPLPDWIRKHEPAAIQAPPRALAPSARIPKGVRNNHLTSLAGSMRRRGMSAEAIVAALQTENSLACSPPLDSSEVARIAASIGQKTPGTDQAGFDDTELAAAHRFFNLFQGDLRFVPERGCFALWRDRWLLDEDGSLIHAAFEAFLQVEGTAALAESDPDRRARRTKAALKLQSRKTIDAVLALVKRLPGVPIRYSEFDATAHLFQCANGVVDLRTGDFRPAAREDFCLRKSPVAFDPEATCPAWEGFLLWAMSGNVGNVGFLQKLSGYLMVGHGQEEVLPILHGGGANGKSTLREIIRRMLGAYACVAMPSLLIERETGAASNDIARLAGARAVFVSETDDGDRLSEATVKYLTQQEPISARFLHREFFEFRPQFKCVLATNHRPIVRGADDGIWRRLVLIPFTNQIPESARDPHFVDRVLMPEAAGILAWMVRGAAEYHKNGLQIPASIRAATADYRAKSDLYAEWFSDCLEADSTNSNFLSNAALWASFESWHRDAYGAEPPKYLSIRGLGRWITDRGAIATRGAARGYYGFRFQS